MKRFILVAAAAAALVAASAAVATLRWGDAVQVSATLSATTAANVQTRTLTCAGQTIEITTGRYTGTATSSTGDLNGPVELHVKSVYNVTRKLGWIDGRLKIRGADDRTHAGFSAVNVDGKLDGWLRGSAGHRDGILFGSLAGSFSKTGGLTDGTILRPLTSTAWALKISILKTPMATSLREEGCRRRRCRHQKFRVRWLRLCRAPQHLT